MGGERGDAAEVTAFCRDEHPRLVGLLGLYCGDAVLAADAAVAALVRVVDDWPRTRAHRSPGARLLGVGMALADARRRRPAPAGGAPADAVEAVRAALGQVPRRERQVLLLRLYAGCSLADTAGVLRLPPGVVASLTARGLHRLRAEMGGWWPRRSHDEETPAPLPAAAPEPAPAADDDHELWRPPPPRETASAWLAPESGSWGAARGG